jgi:hypothetical protein
MQLLILPTIPQEEPTKQQQLLHFFIRQLCFPILSPISPLLSSTKDLFCSWALSWAFICRNSGGLQFLFFLLGNDVYRSHNDIVHFIHKKKQKPSKALHYIISSPIVYLTTIMKIAALTLAAVVIGYAHAQQQAGGSTYINEIKLMDGHKMRSKVVSPLPHT